MPEVIEALSNYIEMNFSDFNYEERCVKKAIQKLIETNKKLKEENTELITIKETIRVLQDNNVQDDLYYVVARKEFLKNKYKEQDDYIPVIKLQELKKKLQKEWDCAREGFMKKQIPTSVVDGTIVQEIGWILQEIDKLLEGEK